MISKQYFNLETTTIENLFIEEYMPYASKTQNNVYLMGLNILKQEAPSIELIAKKLNISIDEVMDSYKYWESLGIVTINSNDVIYMSIRQVFIDSNFEKKRISNSTLASKKFKSLFNKINSHISIDLIEAERMKLVRFLNDNEIDDAIVLEAYLHYKKSKNRTDNAIKLLISLVENNVKTLDDYYKYKEDWNYRNQCYKKVLTAIGKPYSPPNSGEKESIDKWLDTYNYSIDEILDKIKEVTKRTSSVNMNYLDAVFSGDKKEKKTNKKTTSNKKKDYSHLITNR